jgi:hypothetical protein
MYLRQKIGEKATFFDQLLLENWIITLVFEKNANFFRRKSAKIMIITSTLGR